MPIRVLEPIVAAKIAAGEIVERPASVVKELVENCLDAQATQITVEIQGGGIELIRVTDNGVGIPTSELQLAIERHATSKISSESDLDSIATMGFRGEALGSISAVSNLNVTSRCRGANQGGYVQLKNGALERSGVIGCSEGTTVTVQDLFENIPARRKFLRSETAESGRIHRLIGQLAPAFPDIRFQLITNGRVTLATQGRGDLREVLASVYNRSSADALLPLADPEWNGYSINGLVSPPHLTRANRSAINFYVNRRWVQSRLMLQALEEAYRGLLMEHRHPLASLHIQLPPQEIDVNIHPTKQEIRFQQEDSVFALVQRAVRGPLVAQSPVPLVLPSRHTPTHFRPHVTSIDPSQTPLALQIVPRRQPDVEARDVRLTLMAQTLPVLRVLGQANKTYIVAEGPEGIYLIDQHAAHERVRYEQVIVQVHEKQTNVQGLLEPVAVELLPGQRELLERWHDVLNTHGFLGETFGDQTYLLRGVPAGIKDRNPDALLSEALDNLAKALDVGQAASSLAASIACHSAVRAGDSLTVEEMTGLVRELEKVESPHTCPHGRPTMLHLSINDLERDFGRT